MTATGNSNTAATVKPAGSAACAQQPQVTQVGGQDASSPPASSPLASSYVPHGSGTIRAIAPEALNVSSVTMRASAKRGTRSF